MDLIDYMRAHLRLHANNADLRTWTGSEIMESFITLPPPKVTFQEWLESMSYLYKELGEEEEKEGKEQEDKSLSKMDPYERLTKYHKSLIDQGIVKIEAVAPEEAKATA